MDATFFDMDPPIVQGRTGEIMCWTSQLTDASGCVDVRVWDNPCYEILGVTASKLRQMWETGVECDAERDTLLEQLNGNLDRSIRANCTGKIWSYGGQTSMKHQRQINVEALELLDS